MPQPNPLDALPAGERRDVLMRSVADLCHAAAERDALRDVNRTLCGEIAKMRARIAELEAKSE